MEKLFIVSGAQLSGEVQLSGSKNAALAIMAGALLAPGKTILHNVPRISDMNTMIAMLNSLGVPSKFVGTHTVTIDATNIRTCEAPYELVRKMRASFSVLGPIVARCGEARVPVPGGCDIGARPVNFHIDGLRRLGARIDVEHGLYAANAQRLQGTNIYLDFQSAGATQHLMTAAGLAVGTTTIENAATEPEIVDLANFLKAMGVKIEGAGTPTIIINGVEELTPIEYTIIPDRMEAGTFAIAAGITRGDIFIRGAVEEHMKPVITKLGEAGVQHSVESDGIRFRRSGRIRPVTIKTMPHPSFPTDLQQPFAAMLCVADGTSTITENVYESRFRYINELNRMGADIHVEGRTAVINGVPRLTGAPVTATDLRAGAALIIGGLVAEGETEISGVDHIDRGYEDIAGKLAGLGALIRRGDEVENNEGVHVCSI